MGTADPDFPDAEKEADELAKLMKADVLMVEDSGHYPRADNPDQVAPAIIDLVRGISRLDFPRKGGDE